MTEPKPVAMKSTDGPLKVTLGKDGEASVRAKKISSTMDTILSFGIENITDIRSYNIEHKDGKICHSVLFHSGGTIELSFMPDGTNFSASVHGMAQQVIDGDRIYIKEKPKN